MSNTISAIPFSGTAEQAAKLAISSPLLETSISGARGILINITASPDIGLDEMYAAVDMVTKEAHPDSNNIWGATFDPQMEDEMRITVIATGFTAAAKKATPKPAGTTADTVTTADAVEVDTKPDADDGFDAIIGLLNRGKK